MDWVTPTYIERDNPCGKSPASKYLRYYLCAGPIEDRNGLFPGLSEARRRSAQAEAEQLGRRGEGGGRGEA